MSPNEYQTQALRSESTNYLPVHPRLLHGAMGLCTEAGELQDTLKKTIFYNHPLDRDNLLEEMGDILWYLAILCSALDTDLEFIMRLNIAKLRTRYPSGWTTDDEQARRDQKGAS